ncbi:MAG: hypothetical protein IJT62_08620 [Oscillospiraceae bacterium]|nr:hypothetical protein [Oscillospiraceae bacterium]
MDEKKLIGDAGRTEYLREIVEELKNDPDWQLPPPARFWLYGPWEWDLIYQ